MNGNLQKSVEKERKDSQNPHKRLDSLHALVSQPDAQTHDILLACLNDKANIVRSYVATQLVELYDGQDIQHLIPLLADDALVSQNLIRVLRKTKQNLSPILLEHTQSSEPLIRAGCAILLWSHPSQQAVDRLIELLQDPDVRVRVNAAKSLGTMKEQRAIPALLEAMDDRSDFVGRAAIMALGDLKAESAIDVLVARLASEENRFLKHALLYALGELGDPQAAQPLLAVFMDERESEKTRDSAALALTFLGEAGKTALRTALAEGDTFSQQSAKTYLRL